MDGSDVMAVRRACSCGGPETCAIPDDCQREPARSKTHVPLAEHLAAVEREQARAAEADAEVERLQAACNEWDVAYANLWLKAGRLEAEVERLREDRDNRLDQFRRADREADILRAGVERLREELGDAVDQARLFNRGGLTWREYDALLVRWEAIAQSPPSDITAPTAE